MLGMFAAAFPGAMAELVAAGWAVAP
jgi:hypothetical protein